MNNKELTPGDYLRFTGYREVAPLAAVLDNHFPVIGGAARCSAASNLSKLALLGNLSAVWMLAYKIDHHFDEKVHTILAAGLEDLKQPRALSVAWTVWSKTRGKALSEILQTKNPPTGSSPAVLALSLLFLQRMETLQNAGPAIVDALVECTADEDAVIASRARFAIAHLTAPEGIARLCQLWASGRSSSLLDTMIQAGYQPESPVQTALLVALKMNRLDRVTYGHEEIVPHLLAACDDADPEIAARARFCLLNLQQGDAIDTLCAVWANKRGSRLEQVVLQGGYLARQPARVHVLTALKLERMDVAAGIGPDELPELLTAMKDKDATIAARAAAAVRQLQQQSARERLCQMVIDHDAPELRKIALEAGYLPADPPQRALFLFLTNQISSYEVLDFDRRLLNAVYETSSQAIRQRILRRIQQTGRQDFLTILTGADDRLRASRMTPIESQLIVQMLAANREWERLWSLAQVLPLEFAVEIIRLLALNHWQPAEESERPIFDRVATLTGQKLAINSTDLAQVIPPAIPRAVLKVNGRINDLAFAPDSTLLAVGAGSRRVALWDYQRAVLVQTFKGFEHSIGHVIYTDTGCLFCAERASSGPCGIYLCEDETPLRIGQHSQPITALEAWREGLVLSAGRDSQVGLWDSAKRSLYHSTRVYDWPRAVCVSAAASRAALLTTMPSLLTLPDLAPQAQVSYRRGKGMHADLGMVRSAGFLPGSGSNLLAGQLNGYVILYQHEANPTLRPVSRFPGAVEGVLAVPGHDLMAVAGGDGEVRFFSLPDFKSHRKVKSLHPGRLISLHISPDGAFMATGSSESTVTLWDLRVLDIPDLFSRPLATARPGQIPAVLALTEYQELPAPLRNALLVLGNLLQLRFRYDIQVSEIPTIQVGEFDVMIDE